jgi:hypothetical protein
MFDRIELIRALNSILELMFDGFCEACSRLAIYEKMKKILCQLNLALKDISFSFISLTNRSHHQIVLIVKSFLSSRFYQVVVVKSFSSSSNAYYQAVFIIKSIYQVNLSNQSIKLIYQVILSSQFIKSFYQVILSSYFIKSIYQVTLSSYIIKRS